MMNMKNSKVENASGISRRKFLAGGTLAATGLGLGAMPQATMGAVLPGSSSFPDLRIKQVDIPFGGSENKQGIGG